MVFLYTTVHEYGNHSLQLVPWYYLLVQSLDLCTSTLYYWANTVVCFLKVTVLAWNPRSIDWLLTNYKSRPYWKMSPCFYHHFVWMDTVIKKVILYGVITTNRGKYKSWNIDFKNPHSHSKPGNNSKNGDFWAWINE